MSGPAPVPELVSGIDVRQLPLTAREGFVLSRIDGYSDVNDIAAMTGGDLELTLDSLVRLAELGAVKWKNNAGPVRPKAATPPAAPSSKSEAGATAAPVASSAKRVSLPDGLALGLYDAALLEEDVEIEPERRKEILDTFYQLDKLTLYMLLGVDATAEKKEIRTAYFELSKRFHPDTLFRKRVGTYKSKMEAIFKKITEAYEVLGKASTRAAYDDYVALSRMTKRTERELEEGDRIATIEARRSIAPPNAGPRSLPLQAGPPSNEPAPRMSSPGERQARAAERLQRGLNSRPPEATPVVPSGSRDVVIPPEPRVPIVPIPAGLGNEQTTGSLQRPPEDSSTPFATEHTTAVRMSFDGVPTMDRPRLSLDDARAAGAELARSLAQIRGGAPVNSDPIMRHMTNARAAEVAGNLVEAANTWRLALALEPTRADLQLELDRVKKLLALQMAPAYEKQAKYEEENGRWKEAAISWLNIVEARPQDAPALSRCVEAHVQANFELRRAQKLAQRWVELEPQNVRARIALGRIFVSIGLRLNARRELETAAKLDPANEMVKNLLNDLAKP